MDIFRDFVRTTNSATTLILVHTSVFRHIVGFKPFYRKNFNKNKNRIVTYDVDKNEMSILGEDIQVTGKRLVKAANGPLIPIIYINAPLNTDYKIPPGQNILKYFVLQHPFLYNISNYSLSLRLLQNHLGTYAAEANEYIAVFLSHTIRFSVSPRFNLMKPLKMSDDTEVEPEKEGGQPGGEKPEKEGGQPEEENNKEAGSLLPESGSLLQETFAPAVQQDSNVLGGLLGQDVEMNP